MEKNKVNLGNCLEGLKDIPDNSVDCCVTDPPYGWAFMGNKWDYEIPSVDIWREVLRVLKPGAHILVACGTRTQHRMAVNIEDAGFEIRDVISWHYGSGFPKSLDVSKAIDKRNGRYFDEGFKAYCNECRTRKGYTLAQVNELMGTALTGGGFASSIMGEKEENELPTLDMYRKLKDILGMDDRYGNLIEMVEAERQIIGEKMTGNAIKWYENKGEECNSVPVDVTTAATDEAKKWEGWGTSLKPATEFWTMARKPFTGPVAQAVLQYGTGALNIDASRIAAPDIEPGKTYNNKRLNPGATVNKSGNWTPDEENARRYIGVVKDGRWPANMILDDFMATELDRQSGELSSGTRTANPDKNKPASGYRHKKDSINGFDGDSGGASRFFYVAKPSPAERGTGSEFPTVKPLLLMQYLIKLICPIEPGRVVLEPFAGSGSTCIAAKHLGIDFIAFEQEAEHMKIIEKRFREQFGLFYGT